MRITVKITGTRNEEDNIKKWIEESIKFYGFDPRRAKINKNTEKIEVKMTRKLR